MATVAFVTYCASPGIAAGDRLAVPHLCALGVEVVAAPWDAPDVDWGGFDAVVLRSCWDYHRRPDAFHAWLDRVERAGAPLWNPLPAVRWNMDKRYLRDLAARSVPVPPTVWLPQGAQTSLAALLEERRWERAVVKPAVSASAFETWLATPQSAAQDQARLDRVLAGSGVLVQRFVEQVVANGEWSLIFFNKRFSHAVLKRAGAGDFRVQNDHGGTFAAAEPPAYLVAQAQQLLDAQPQPLLYARVDGVDAGGALLLMELELIEPSLFLTTHPSAPQRFAEALAEVI